ncbi:MAG TPA: hypothetical protein VGF55_08890, partial [Gemmataceae bacterium]
TDTNQFDFFHDGSGKGTCFSGNTSSTFDDRGSPNQAALYPTCPAPNKGTGDNNGDSDQVGALATYVTSDPPCSQEDSWARHSHPPFEERKPIDTRDFGDCS